jgi:hypothetical protein
MTASSVRPAEASRRLIRGVWFSRDPVYHKVVAVTYELLQSGSQAPRHEIHLEAPPAQDVPLEIDDVTNPDVLDNICRLHRGGNTDPKFVVGGTILAFEDGRRAKRVQLRCNRRGFGDRDFDGHF